MESILNKQAFSGLQNCTWLFSGAESPPHRGLSGVLQDYLQARGQGPIGREQNLAVEMNCRSNVARLLNGSPEEIAFVSNASEAISIIANAVDLKPGDNVVLNTLEFPSGVYPFLLLQQKGVEIRRVEHRDWQVSVDDVMQQVDSRTRLVMTSHVSFVNGARFDYQSLYKLLKNTETLLLLDATQSLGSVPVHMYDADFVVSSSYKWLLSIHGLGILAINPARVGALMPKTAGWRSVKGIFGEDRFEAVDFTGNARKFELGYPSFSTIYTLNFTSGLLLDIGISRIEQHILALGGYLIEQLKKLNYKVMTPEESARRAGNISFEHPYGEQQAEQLLSNNIYVWGGDGRIRASIHLFNDRSDIDRLVSMLEPNPYASGNPERR